MVDTPTIWKDFTQANTADAPALPTGNFSQFDSQIVALPDGGYVVVWTDGSRTHNPGGYAVVGQRYDAFGNKVGGEVKLSEFSSGDQHSQAVALLPNGNLAVAFWSAGDLYVEIRGPGLEHIRLDAIETGVNVARDPAITAFADGSYLITYTDVVTIDNTDVVRKIVSANGAVGGAVDMHTWDDNSGPSAVATLSNGNAVIVFQDEVNNTENSIRLEIVTPGGVDVPTAHWVGGAADSLAEERDPDVAALKGVGGGFVVAWWDAAGADVGDIRMTVYDNAGSVVAGDLLVNTSTAGFQASPTVAALADGGFVVSWADFNTDSVRAQRFGADGAKIGLEFLVKTGVPGKGGDVDSAGLADGRLAYAADGLENFLDSDVFTAIFDPRTSPISGTDAGDILTSRHEGAAVAGLNGNDTLFGLAGNDTLFGGAGADTMLGGGGDDTYTVDDPGDQVIENSGAGTDIVLTRVSFTLSANVESLTLSTSADINGVGNELANTILGGDGNNVIDGGLGNDSLTGGPGADSFLFSTALKPKGSNVDTIADFSHTDDTILLDNAIFAKLKKDGDLKKKYFEMGKKADDEDDYIVYNKKTGDLFYDKNGDHKGGAVLFAHLEGSPNDLSKADFFVV